MGILSELILLGEVALAMALAAAIGWNREKANRPAGLRTHMLVAAAGALLYGSVVGAVPEIDQARDADWLRADPFRVVEALVAGISFLGAGTIFVSGKENSVKGLTTAASLLVSGCVGLSVAMNHYTVAIGATVLAVLTLTALNRMETRFLHEKDGDGPEES
jgi:putative Mg2+ transporter-C (MgtC) family protein